MKKNKEIKSFEGGWPQYYLDDNGNKVIVDENGDDVFIYSNNGDLKFAGELRRTVKNSPLMVSIIALFLSIIALVVNICV